MPLRRLLVGWVIVFTALTFYALYENRERGEQLREFAVQNRQRAMEGQEAHAAICTLRADLQRRIADGRDFLEDHPDGIPGISAADIRRSIAGQEATLKALHVRNCEGGL